jgi:hypothetical protein
VLVGFVVATPASAACRTGGVPELEELEQASVTLAEIVAKLVGDRPTYLFIGERHPVGPVKRFVVDLSDALIEAGFDVGIYVEGFRTDCSPADDACRSLARAFGADAFYSLLEQARAPVHPIAPPERFERTRRMAERIAAGAETIRIVLVGNSHVLHAGDPDAELWVYGGGMRYPDPGDLVEAFPRQRSLTFALREGAPPVDRHYVVWANGCDADYTLYTDFRLDY